MQGVGGHTAPNHGRTDCWLTPPEIIEELGPFDLDPCAAKGWETARSHYILPQDGLALPWNGRVWLNPPYGKEAVKWLAKLADHGDGIALVFARTETAMFFGSVWGQVDAVLFLRGRLHFYDSQGVRAKGNSGGPSVLLAYGEANAERLLASGLPGAYCKEIAR